jgi:DNA-binding transcriptional LysR family regulator
MVDACAACDARLMEQHWLGVEFRHLAALEAIEAERSFRGAADRLGYVQSAVSQQLSTLERLVGARLVERSRGQAGVELTEAGAVLLQHAQRILAALNAAHADVDALSDGAGNRVRLGAFQSVAARIIPKVLSYLATSDPHVRVETTEASGDADFFDAVADGSLDCAFAELPLMPGPFDAVELMVDPCVLVVHADSPLARQSRPPTLEEISHLPLAYPKWRMTDFIGHHFRAAGLDPTQTFALETDAAVQALVSAGLAAAIMPLLAVHPDVAETKVIDLSSLLPPRTLAIYWHRDRVYGPALKVLVKATRAICEQMADTGLYGSSSRFLRGVRDAPIAGAPAGDDDADAPTRLAS